MEGTNAGNATVVVGPWGGGGGSPWKDPEDVDGIKEISIVSGHVIISFSVIYSKNGVLIAGGQHGGNNVGLLTKISLDFPDEYIIGASGHIGITDEVTKVVKSLTLTTNRRILGPFGDENGTPFTLPIQEGRIISFTGRSGDYLDAIGFRIRA